MTSQPVFVERVVDFKKHKANKAWAWQVQFGYAAQFGCAFGIGFRHCNFGPPQTVKGFVSFSLIAISVLASNLLLLVGQQVGIAV